MNEYEKKAFEMLSDEEKEEITGGVSVKETMQLTEEECKKLSKKVLSNPDLFDALPPTPTLIAYGGSGKFRPISWSDVYPKTEKIDPASTKE